ncbi:MAG: threonylcarbamoyl-AMP synthase [Verrucomicrobia bacterium]|nr:threonylcarbamoyl-AMP synthase [Verrucomicrobiota bacterium]
MLETQKLTESQLDLAAQLLKEGQLVAFPTETVYGLGARIFDPAAIASIFTAKGRPADNPLIAHVRSLEEVHEIAQEIPKRFYQLAEEFFPGPLTIVLRRHPRVPPIVSAGLDSIALRMPDHPIAERLITLVGEPIVAPSANLSGKPSPTEAAHVLEDLSGKIGAVIDGGKTDLGIESTVISLLEPIPRLLRPGTISKEAIEETLGIKVAEGVKGQGAIVSPGMKYRHYSPKAQISLFTAQDVFEQELFASEDKRRMVLLPPMTDLPMPGNCARFFLTAEDLYRKLRLADQEGFQEILVYCDPSTRENAALMNRLTQAAGS